MASVACCDRVHDTHEKRSDCIIVLSCNNWMSTCTYFNEIKIHWIIYTLIRFHFLSAFLIWMYYSFIILFAHCCCLGRWWWRVVTLQDRDAWKVSMPSKAMARPVRLSFEFPCALRRHPPLKVLFRLPPNVQLVCTYCDGTSQMRKKVRSARSSRHL